MARHLGAYVSSSGGLFNIIQRGVDLNINTVMTHPAPPQKWNSQPFKDEAVQKYLEAKANDNTIEKVYFHGIYLINLANPDKQKFHLSKVSVMYHLDLLRNINGDGVIFHTGSFKDQKDENEGYDRVIYGLNWIFENLEEMPSSKNKNFWDSPKLFLEIAAGSGNVVGDQFEELARIYAGIDKKHQHKLGFCLDTQHMFASGYDIVNSLNDVVEQADSILNLDKVAVIHFNDSKTDLASHKDRHEDLGSADAKIGQVAMSGFLNHPKLKNKDFILETPSLDTPEGALQQVETLKAWAK
jgi:deoxyribonuclease IV